MACVWVCVAGSCGGTSMMMMRVEWSEAHAGRWIALSSFRWMLLGPCRTFWGSYGGSKIKSAATVSHTQTHTRTQ